MAARDDHSSGTRLAARLTRPTRTTRRERLRGHTTKWGFVPCRRPPLFGLAPGGVYPAAPVARGAVRSCRTVSPLPADFPVNLGRSTLGARAVCFLWHCPWGRPRRRLAGTVFPWSPDFPLSAGRTRQAAAVRPSGAAGHARGFGARQALAVSSAGAGGRCRCRAEPLASAGLCNPGHACYRPAWLSGWADGRIAQLVEQLTLNQRAVGSSPTAPTNEIKVLEANQTGLRRSRNSADPMRTPPASFRPPDYWIAARV